MSENIVYGPQADIELPDCTLGQFLIGRLREHGDKIAQVFPHLEYKTTFEQLAATTCSVADELRRRGVAEGDVVSIVTHLEPEFAPLMLGTQLLGAILAPLNPAFDRGDLQQMFQNLQPRLVYSTNVAIEKVQEALKKIDLDVEVLPLNSISSLPECEDPEEYEKERSHDKEDIAIIMCSSGTTGLPKGVTISQKGLFNLILQTRLNTLLFRPDDVATQFSPNFWISGVMMQVENYDSGLQVIASPIYTNELFFQLTEKYQVTLTFLSPRLVVELMKCESLCDANLSSLSTIVVGGAAMNGQIQEQAETAIGLPLYQVYGMTEILIGIGPLPGVEICRGSTGVAAVNVEAKIIEEASGDALGPMQRGELCIRSPCVTNGYYNNEKATAASIDEDGWLHTGDIAYYDEHGCFFVVDRIKDLIKYHGHHVTPGEIEGVLLEHPDVKDAAVVGIPYELDELPLAFVVRKPDTTVSEEDLVNLVQENLAEHKWLRGGVRFLEAIPKTATGKTQRRVLRAIAEQIAAEQFSE